MSEVAVQFEGPGEITLRGIAHEPESSSKRPALVWLSAGQKVRQGAWRMNVAIARAAAAQGHPVLRFDFRGLGDSEGERHHGEPVMDFYGSIQTGGLAGDAVAAVRFARARFGPRPIVLGGLCGGAVTALFAAPRLRDEVRGLVLVDLPVTISSSARQRFLEAHPEALVRARPDVADTVLLLYLRKLLDRSSWSRFVRGESSPELFIEAARVKARALGEPHVHRLPSVARRLVERALGPPIGDVSPDADGAPELSARGEVANEMIAPTFRAVVAARQRVRLLNSSTYHPVFERFFGRDELRASRQELLARGISVDVSPDTNHIFSLEHGRRALLDVVAAALRDL